MRLLECSSVLEHLVLDSSGTFTVDRKAALRNLFTQRATPEYVLSQLLCGLIGTGGNEIAVHFQPLGILVLTRQPACTPEWESMEELALGSVGPRFKPLGLSLVGARPWVDSLWLYLPQQMILLEGKGSPPSELPWPNEAACGVWLGIPGPRRQVTWRKLRERMATVFRFSPVPIHWQGQCIHAMLDGGLQGGLLEYNWFQSDHPHGQLGLRGAGLAQVQLGHSPAWPRLTGTTPAWLWTKGVGIQVNDGEAVQPARGCIPGSLTWLLEADYGKIHPVYQGMCLDPFPECHSPAGELFGPADMLQMDALNRRPVEDEVYRDWLEDLCRRRQLAASRLLEQRQEILASLQGVPDLRTWELRLMGACPALSQVRRVSYYRLTCQRVLQRCSAKAREVEWDAVALLLAGLAAVRPQTGTATFESWAAVTEHTPEIWKWTIHLTGMELDDVWWESLQSGRLAVASADNPGYDVLLALLESHPDWVARKICQVREDGARRVWSAGEPWTTGPESLGITVEITGTGRYGRNYTFPKDWRVKVSPAEDRSVVTLLRTAFAYCVRRFLPAQPDEVEVELYAMLRRQAKPRVQLAWNLSGTGRVNGSQANEKDILFFFDGQRWQRPVTGSVAWEILLWYLRDGYAGRANLLRHGVEVGTVMLPDLPAHFCFDVESTHWDLGQLQEKLRALINTALATLPPEVREALEGSDQAAALKQLDRLVGSPLQENQG